MHICISQCVSVPLKNSDLSVKEVGLSLRLFYVLSENYICMFTFEVYIDKYVFAESSLNLWPRFFSFHFQVCCVLHSLRVLKKQHFSTNSFLNNRNGTAIHFFLLMKKSWRRWNNDKKFKMDFKLKLLSILFLVVFVVIGVVVDASPQSGNDVEEDEIESLIPEGLSFIHYFLKWLFQKVRPFFILKCFFNFVKWSSFLPEEYSEENYDAVENLTSIPTTVSTEGKIFFLTITSIFLEGQEWG